MCALFPNLEIHTGEVEISFSLSSLVVFIKKAYTHVIFNRFLSDSAVVGGNSFFFLPSY